MNIDGAKQALAQARDDGGWLVYVSFEMAGVERVGVLLVAGPEMVKVREWPSRDTWSVPLEDVALVDRPTGAPLTDEDSRAAAAQIGTAGATADYEPLGEPLTIDTMTDALADGAHPWVTWEDQGQRHVGLVDGFLPDDVGAVRIARHPDGAKVRALVGRLTLFRGSSVPWSTMLERVSPTPGGGPAPIRPSDREPYITAEHAPVNARGERWVPPQSLNNACRERDAAIIDATRTRAVLWRVLRGLAISEAQAQAWVSLLLEGDPNG